jgi:hypothetical protein
MKTVVLEVQSQTASKEVNGACGTYREHPWRAPFRGFLCRGQSERSAWAVREREVKAACGSGFIDAMIIDGSSSDSGYGSPFELRIRSIVERTRSISGL